MKVIQFTKGCPNNCHYCYEPKEMEYLNPDIPIDQPFQISDMNLLANPDASNIIARCGLSKYSKELICGIDYRLLTQDKANWLKENGFIKIRWAWDYNYTQQKIHQRTWKMLVKAGYKPEELSVFMIVNWKIPYVECCKKLDLLKVWNVKVNDCCWDGGYKIAKPVHWKPEHIKKFRAMCRKHNQLVLFKIDPEYNSSSPEKKQEVGK